MHKPILDTPEAAARYWREAIAGGPAFEPGAECVVVLLLNTRLRCLGHHVVALGSLDTVYLTPAQVYRAAIASNAHSIVVMHNHPSGDSSPSEADTRITKDLQRAGELLKVRLVDHIVMGDLLDGRTKDYTSMRETGWI
jgi:DNA repair protein RadC